MRHVTCDTALAGGRINSSKLIEVIRTRLLEKLTAASVQVVVVVVVMMMMMMMMMTTTTTTTTICLC
jgi:hypothetical protein